MYHLPKFDFMTLILPKKKPGSEGHKVGDRREMRYNAFLCLQIKSFIDTSFFIVKLILVLQFQKKNLQTISSTKELK